LIAPNTDSVGLWRRVLHAMTPGRLRPIGLRHERINATIVKDSWSSHGESLGRAYSPQEYAEVYEREPWVYSCCDAIAVDVSSLPMQILDGEKQPVDEPWPGVFDVFVEPSPGVGFDQLLRELILDYLLLGESFEWWDGGQLYRLPAWATRAVASKTERIKHFELKVEGRKDVFAPEEVIYIRNPSPLLYVDGMSVLDPLRDTLEKAGAQVKYEKALWKNSARVPGLLKTEQPLDPKQREQHQREWHSKYGGPRNSGKTAVLSHGLTYERVGLDVQESGYHASREENREEILAVLGVPPVRVGLQKHVNYANAMQQMAGYWRSRVRPIAKLYSDAHSRTVFRDVPFWLWLNADNSVFTAADKDMLWTLAARATGWRQVITQNEARALLGYPKHEDPDADEVNKAPTNLWPATPGGAAKLTETDKLAEVSEAEKAESDGEARSVEHDGYAQRRALILNRAAQVREAAHQETLDREAEICREQVAEPLIDAMLKANLDAVARDVREHGLRVYTRTTMPKLPTGADFADMAGESLRAYLEGMVERVGEKVIDEMGEAKRALRRLSAETREIPVDDGGAGELLPSLDLFDPEVKRMIEEREQLIKTVPSWMQKKARELVAEAVEEGATVDDIRRQLNAFFNNLRKYEAERIARTESGTGANTATNSAMSKAGVTEKAWLAFIDGQTRATHIANHEEGPIPFTDRFPNGMRYPQESGAPAGEVINCRCTMIATEIDA